MDLTPAEWRDRDEKALADLKATGIFQPFEKEYFRKDGSRVPVLLGGAFFEGSGNDGVAFVLDLSEQERAEKALRRSEAFLAESQHLSQIGSFSWHVATDEITWSEQLYRTYEFEIGLPVTLELIRTRVHPEDVSLIEKMIDQARDGGQGFEWQYRLLMPDRSIKYMHAVAHSIRDQDAIDDNVLLSAIRNAFKRSAAALDDQAELEALRKCHASLTPREREVMRLVASGALNKQIGLKLGINEITVKAHRGKMMQKMKANSVADLVKIAVRLGLTPARNPWHTTETHSQS